MQNNYYIFEKNNMKIIHISDLHHPKFNKAEKLIGKIIEHYQNIDIKPIVIISGDLVNTVDEKCYSEIKGILQKLKSAGFDLLLCPGNHDLKLKGSLSSITDKQRKLFRDSFFDLLPKSSSVSNDLYHYPLVNKYENHYFIGLDSNTSGKRTAKGLIGTKQLNLLENLLSEIKTENENAKIILYLHHFPFGMNKLASWWFLLRDGNKLLEVIKNKVNVVLFGHIHCTHRFTEEEKKFNIDFIQLNGKTLDMKYNFMKKCFYTTACTRISPKNKLAVRWIQINTDDYSSEVIQY